MAKTVGASIEQLIYEHSLIRENCEPEEGDDEAGSDDWAGRLIDAERSVLRADVRSWAHLRLKLRFFARDDVGPGWALPDVVPQLCEDFDRAAEEG